MKRNENISIELKELGSSLPESAENVYAVPAGYFDKLPARILERIKADEELSTLSPLLQGLSRRMDYSLPEGYFEQLTPDTEKVSDSQSASEEIAELSPLLNSIDRRTPYAVPEGYFENLAVIPDTPAKLVSITRKSWFRYATAAVVTGLIVAIGFLIFNRNEVDPDVKPFAWVEKEFKKVSTDEIDAFVDLVDNSTLTVSNSATPVEVSKLLNEVTPEEIEAFLDDTGIDFESDDILN